MSQGMQPWSVQFRKEREAAWKELERVVQHGETAGLHKLGTETLTRLPTLYRAVVSSLSVARASVLDKGLLEFLESLAARAYLLVYAPKRTLRATLVPYFLSGFPCAVRSIARHVAVSAALLLLGAGIAYAMVDADLEQYYLFLGQEMAQGRDPSSSVEDLRKTLFHDDGDEGLLSFATFLFTHNSSVGILTYGLGFLFGLPVILLLFYNGMMLGAMTALFTQRGLAVEWWSWILPHGVTELLAIVLCGAAGLAVGEKLIFAGRRSRLEELASIGRRMGGVVAGAVGMLLLAGFVEGVFRQVVHDLVVRYLLAAVFALSWLAYFWRAGRGRR